MPSTSESQPDTHFYGFRSVTHARKLMCLFLSLGYRPSVVFTVGDNGAIVTALGNNMPDVYVRIRSLRMGLLDWTTVPDLLSRGLKPRARKALLRHVSTAVRAPISVSIPENQPAQ
jgi:hypothetical protein